MLEVLALTAIAYLSGSVLYAKVIARYVLKVDLSTVGDGNPGTTNIARAGGAKWALVVFVLECLKSAVPTAIAIYTFGINGLAVVPVAVAGALGHMYPVWHGFRGGKAIAALAGSWIAIALWEVISVGGIMLLFWAKSVTNSGWITVFMLSSVTLYVFLVPSPLLWKVYILVTFAVLVWTHRRDLRTAPTIKPWVKTLTHTLWTSSQSSPSQQSQQPSSSSR